MQGVNTDKVPKIFLAHPVVQSLHDILESFCSTYPKVRHIPYGFEMALCLIFLSYFFQWSCFCVFFLLVVVWGFPLKLYALVFFISHWPNCDAFYLIWKNLKTLDFIPHPQPPIPRWCLGPLSRRDRPSKSPSARSASTSVPCRCPGIVRWGSLRDCLSGSIILMCVVVAKSTMSAPLVLR